MAPECCCRRLRVSVLSVGDSMHEVQWQRPHGHQLAARFLVGRGRHCWRHAVKSVMQSRWPAWAGWWRSLTPIRALCTRRQSLYSIRCTTGSQCNSWRAGSYMVVWFQVEHVSCHRVQDSLQWCHWKADEDGVAVVEARQRKGRDQSR